MLNKSGDAFFQGKKRLRQDYNHNMLLKHTQIHKTRLQKSGDMLNKSGDVFVQEKKAPAAGLRPHIFVKTHQNTQTTPSKNRGHAHKIRGRLFSGKKGACGRTTEGNML